MKLYVYCLRDPGDSSPHYVGLTKSPEKRFKIHLRASTTARVNSKLFAWIDGKFPVMDVLEECEGEADGRLAEARWVEKFQNAGFSLFNQRGGGTYHTWSDEARKKLSEIAKRQGRRPPPHTAETNAKIAQKNRERGQDPARFIALNKSRIGIPLSHEHRRKVSVALRKFYAQRRGDVGI